jgi:diaminohydroxyphosphoribosylaminopyrimidine deaminase/5-amino-6-(5-phosphoribosylamino)uracil reductase
VGCVLVRDGQVIGEGFTQPAGGNHAEIEALQAAGDARGSTAYVTLEPCNHHGKTGPCAQALIDAGVTRVVAALADPNPQVGGGGLGHLRAAGVDVHCGVLQGEAEQLIAGFLARMRRGRGRVRAKLAMSLDGRTAMASGQSQWITGAAARQDVQRLRAQSCAIVTGVGSILADNSSLTVRPAELGVDDASRARAARRHPLRVVLDSALRTPADARVLDDRAPSLLCYAQGTAVEQTHAHLDLLALPAGEGLDLHSLVAAMSARQCNEILVESGPRVAGAFLQAGLLDELIIYMAPCLLGSDARPLFNLPFTDMAEKVQLDIRDVRKVGQDWRFTAVPVEATNRR